MDWHDVGIEVVLQCKQLLLSYGIQDVDVELRESDFVQSASSALFEPVDIIDHTALAREPLATALGMNICAENTPWVEGTVGFFMAVDGVDKLYGVTARHALFPQAENKDFECTNDSEPRHSVQLLSEAAFREHFDVIQKEIDCEDFIINIEERRIARVVGLEDNEARMIHENAEDEMRRAKWRKECIITILPEIKRQRSSPESHILGHVKFSPQIGVGVGNPEQQFTQNITVFEVELSMMIPADFPETSSTLERSAHALSSLGRCVLIQRTLTSSSGR